MTLEKSGLCSNFSQCGFLSPSCPNCIVLGGCCQSGTTFLSVCTHDLRVVVSGWIVVVVCLFLFLRPIIVLLSLLIFFYPHHFFVLFLETWMHATDIPMHAQPISCCMPKTSCPFFLKIHGTRYVIRLLCSFHGIEIMLALTFSFYLPGFFLSIK